MKFYRYHDKAGYYHHHRLTIKSNGIGRYFIKPILWAYLIFYGFGRVTYLRLLPQVLEHKEFDSLTVIHQGCVRFTSTMSLGKWVYPMKHDESEILGFGGRK